MAFMAVLDSPVEIRDYQFSVLSSQFSVLSSQKGKSHMRQLSTWDFTGYWVLAAGNCSSATLARPPAGALVMAEKKPQTFANHTRYDPLFHFFVLPVFLLLPFVAAGHFIWRPSLHAGLLFVVAMAAAVAVLKIRTYAVKVQDRVIRLEERMRLASLLPEPLRSRIPELAVSQLVALRFASDAELPGLAERALSEKLSSKDIKKAIQAWRPDYWRV
jgi:hypothetical protein